MRDPSARAETMHFFCTCACAIFRKTPRSQDATFAPLDESLVREHDRGLPDSLIETGTHDQIDIYPLAEHSEWAIRGQSFRELPPGEALETDLVSAPEALEQSS